MEPPWAVVVDRNQASLALTSEILEEQGFSVVGTDDASAAREAFEKRRPAIVAFGFASGHDFRSLIESAVAREPRPLIVGVGESDNEVAAELFDVVPVPVGRAGLERMVRRCRSRLALNEQIGLLRAELQQRRGYTGFVGRSDAIRRLRDEIERLAGSDEPVWIDGEPGTGRETAARLLQAQSSRRDGEFVVADCTKLHRLDSVISADGDLARGIGGTLYLEELPALRTDLQEGLMRAIGVHRARAAGSRPARIVVGSRSDAERVETEGRLLPELRRKLAGASLSIPPLRARREDIVLLADYFLAQICEINRLSRIRLGHDAVALLERYSWPGNVEQLRGAIEQAAIVVRGEVIHPADLPAPVRELHESSGAPTIAEDPSTRPFREAKRDVVEAFEQSYLAGLLERHTGNVTAASQQAGMLRSALQRLLRKYGLKSAEFRRGRRAAARATGEPADDSR